MAEFLKPIIKKLFLKYRYKEHIEFEIRFGWYDKLSKAFNSDVGKDFFEIISNRLCSYDKWNQIIESEEIAYYTKSGIRLTTDPKGVIRQACVKTKLEVQDIIMNGCPYDIRISVSSEKPCEYNKHSTFVYTRNKERKSYIYKMWSYDLTIVETPMKYFKDKYKESNFSYEFEIELRDFDENVDNDYLSQSISMKIEDVLHMSNEKINLKNAILVL